MSDTRRYTIAHKVREGLMCKGIWLNLPSEFTARWLSRFELDFITIDAEHAPLDPSVMYRLISAISGSGKVAPLVRTAGSDERDIKMALDAGAYGIIVPMVNTAAQAREVVRWSRYPPSGSRSFGNAMAGFAFGQRMREYLRAANDQTLVAVQIEHRDALDRLEEIFSVDGLDLAFVGPSDLSLSLGLEPAPENQHPVFLEALERIRSAASRLGMPLGIYCSGPEAARQRLQEGFSFVVLSSDMQLLDRAMNDVLDSFR